MSVISSFLTFLHYVLTPLRFILFMLSLIVVIQIICQMEDEMTIQALVLLESKFLIYLLSMNICISKEHLEKYMNYLHSDKKFLVVFNHTTFIDGFIILSTFPNVSFVMLKTLVYTVIGYTETFHRKTKGIFISKGETAKNINDSIQKRSFGDNVVFIAPGSGYTPAIPENITEFRGSGAFAGKYPILPIVIKYEDESLNHNYENGESMLHSCLKLFLLQNYKIKIVVDDMIESNEQETIEEYKARVYDVMNTKYKSMKI